MRNYIGFKIIGVKESLTEEKYDAFICELERYQNTLVKKVKQVGEINETLDLGTGREVIYKSFNFKLVDSDIEVRLVS